MTTKPRNSESGYVLLFVFAMSAIVAIGLYEQLPRAAFEAQRDKEALLIMHGQQYIRGVQLYVRKLGRYPAKMEDLDNTQNIRFLRKHYLDPMTGKDEWRLLHMGPNGKLIDSKIKAPDANADQWHQGSITEFKSASSSDDGDILNANIATRKRPSDDQGQPPMQGGPASGGAPDPSLLASGAPGGSAPGAGPGTNNGALPGMPPGSQRGINPQAPGGLAQNQNSGSPATSGNQSSVSGNGGYGSVAGNGGYGPPANNTAGAPGPQSPFGQGNAAGPGVQPPGGQPPGGYGTTPGSNMNPQTGFGQQGNQTTATSMINNLLTQPRPGGAPAGVLPGMGGTVMGGLAGVASTYKGRGIKRYNDQEEYNKWEFFYDLGAEQASAAQTQANQMNTGSGLQGNQANQSGQSGFGGTQGGFGATQSGFGATQSGFGQSPANQNNGMNPGSGSTMGSPAPPRSQ